MRLALGGLGVFSLIGGLSLLAGAGQAQPAGEVAPHTGWTMYGGASDSTQYSALTQVNRTNVAKLREAWSYDMGSSVSLANAIVIDGVVYIPGKDRSIVALDAATGRQIWRRAGPRIFPRGLTFWKSPDGGDRRIIYFEGQAIRELNAKDGSDVAGFGADGKVDLREGLGRPIEDVGWIQPITPGKIFGDILILGSNPGENYGGAPGDIRAYDVRTGRKVWTFHTIPHPGEPGYETWDDHQAWKTASAANNWGGMSIDEARGIVYIPLGSASYDFWGGDRLGSNLYANSLVALDARTGKRLWHFQTVHHDLWDYDLTSSPVLLTIKRDGKPLDIVVQAAKNGFVFAFNRVTGKPVWPIEERPVPKSTLASSPAWPTQPYPTVLEPFARQSFTGKDVDPNLPAEEREAIISQLRAARNEGLFTPPGTQESVEMPGNHGGVNWGLTAGDPARARFYVESFDLPSILKLEQSENLLGELFTSARDKGAALYRANCRLCHGAERQGQPPAIPPLNGVVQRLTADTTRQVIHEGRNTMPPFAGVLSSADIDAVVAYLKDPPASGGDHAAGGSAPAPKPAGLARYQTGYGFLLSAAGNPAIRPPWLTLTAYDMQTGKRLWQSPVGSVLDYPQKNTGVSRNKGGVVVTAGGLVLSTTSEDRMLHVWDADTGKIIWEYGLPSVPQGVPSVYEAGGREFIIVPAAYYSANNILFPKGFGDKPAHNAYVALALPQ